MSACSVFCLFLPAFCMALTFWHNRVSFKSARFAAVCMAIGLASLTFAQPGDGLTEKRSVPSARHYSEGNSESEYDANQVYLFSVIQNRRTVRKFKPTPIPDERLVKILNAARYAPTAGNQQPWKFLVIRDRSKLDQLAEEALSWFLEVYTSKHQPSEEEYKSTLEAVRDALENALSAPVYVAVLVDSTSEYSKYVTYDGVLAAGYLMIAARSLGYGTGFFTTFFPEDRMRLFFDIPEQYKLICFTPIGVPETWPEMPAKKDLDEFIVYESFDKK